VLARAVDHLAADDDDGDGAGDHEASDDVIASALGDRLARVIAGDGREAELEARNADLAAALGACDCWGDRVDCPICDGAGGPGWTRPEAGLFAAYVHPALSEVARERSGPADDAVSASDENEEANGYDDDLAG